MDKIPDNILNPDLYRQAKRKADATFEKHGAYKSMYIQTQYKKLGGKYKGKKPTQGVTRWKKEYDTWRADNPQVKNIPETEVMFSNLQKQFELAKQNKAGTSPENISVRLDKIEHNLKKLMAHLGLK